MRAAGHAPCNQRTGYGQLVIFICIRICTPDTHTPGQATGGGPTQIPDGSIVMDNGINVDPRNGQLRAFLTSIRFRPPNEATQGIILPGHSTGYLNPFHEGAVRNAPVTDQPPGAFLPRDVDILQLQVPEGGVLGMTEQPHFILVRAVDGQVADRVAQAVKTARKRAFLVAHRLPACVCRKTVQIDVSAQHMVGVQFIAHRVQFAGVGDDVVFDLGIIGVPGTEGGRPVQGDPARVVASLVGGIDIAPRHVHAVVSLGVSLRVFQGQMTAGAGIQVAVDLDVAVGGEGEGVFTPRHVGVDEDIPGPLAPFFRGLDGDAGGFQRALQGVVVDGGHSVGQ